MEDNPNDYKAYLDSFNKAYLLQKHLPELGKQIAKSLNDSLWSEGFRDGMEQAQIDQKRELPKFLRKDRLTSFKQNKNQIKGKDRDDIDRE